MFEGAALIVLSNSENDEYIDMSLDDSVGYCLLHSYLLIFCCTLYSFIGSFSTFFKLLFYFTIETGSCASYLSLKAFSSVP